MAQLSRAIQRIFGESGGVDEFAEIGSRAAGSPQTSKDLTDIQSRVQFLQGWFQTTIRQTLPDGTEADLPASEDLNSLFYLLSTQLAYIYQNGIPEWLDSADQRYYADVSFVQVGGDVYQALQGDDGANINAQRNPATEPDWWRLVWSTSATAFYRNLTGATTINLSAQTPPKVIEVTAGTPFTLTLNGFVAPPGSPLVIQNTSANPVTFAGSSGLTGSVAGGDTLFAISDNNAMIAIAFDMDQPVKTTDDVTFNTTTVAGQATVQTLDRTNQMGPRVYATGGTITTTPFVFPEGEYYLRVALESPTGPTDSRWQLEVQNSLSAWIAIVVFRPTSSPGAGVGTASTPVWSGIVRSDGTNLRMLRTFGTEGFSWQTWTLS